MSSDIEVAVSGIGGLFPNCDNYEEFSKSVLANQYLVKYSDRWSKEADGIEPWVGETKFELFDHLFFGMHASVAYWADPTYKAIFERTMEAIIDAGMNPASLRGSSTKVFYSNSKSEYHSRISHFYERPTGYVVMGVNQAMGPNRVSYMFDLQGESAGVASTSASTHLGFKLAYDSIRSSSCDAALVAVSNAAAFSNMSQEYKELGILSEDGVTRSFDKNGTGFARSDANVVFLLQRADLAKRCYAKVVACGAQYTQPRVRFDMTLPNPTGMQAFLGAVYRQAHLDPRDVEYVEADGSGWPLQDETELAVLADLYGPGRQSNGRKPLLVGAAKSNAGHTECAAGALSMCRAIVAMETGTIPATINCSRSSGKDDVVKIVTENSPLSSNSRTAIAVNTIGLTGDMGHTVLRPNLKEKVPTDVSKELPRLIPICGRTETNTLAIAEKVKSYAFDPEYLRLVQDVFSPGVRGYEYRSFVICPPLENEVPVTTRVERRTLWFVYSGMGSQWAGMGRGLMSLPIFGDTIARLHAILEPKGINLTEIITETGPQAFDNILKSFVGITACQIALTNVLTAMGLKPDGIIGHSVGETACAYVDGCLTEEQTILAAWARGKASNEATLIRGMMAAVGLGYADIVKRLPPSIEVACRNSSTSCTLSGPAEDVKRFVAKLSEEGVFARAVNVSDIAYHSRYIQPAAPYLRKLLAPVIPNPVKRSRHWVSTSVPKELQDHPDAKNCSAEYMTNNLLSPVLFEDGLKHIPSEAIMVELAPHGLLQAIVKRECPDNVHVPLCQRGAEDPIRNLLIAIGKLFTGGANPTVSALYPEVTFPVSRGTPPLSPLVGWYHDNSASYSELVDKTMVVVTRMAVPFSPHMTLNGSLLYPISEALEMICEHLAKLKKSSSELHGYVFENITVATYGAIPSDGSTLEMQSSVTAGGRFEVFALGSDALTTQLLVSGTARIRDEDDEVAKPLPNASFTGVESLQAEEVFGDLQSRGLRYTEKYNLLKSIAMGKHDWQIRIGRTDSLACVVECLLQAALLRHGEHSDATALTRTIQRLELDAPLLLDQEVSLRYHLPSGIMQCPGIYMKGLTVAEADTFAFVKKTASSLSSLQFVPYGRTSVKRLSAFLGLALDLTERAAPGVLGLRVLDVQEDSAPSRLGTALRGLLQHHEGIQVEVVPVPVKAGRQLALPEPDPLLATLALSGPGTLAEAAGLVARCGGLLLTCTPAQVQAHLLSLCVLAEQQLIGDGKGSAWFTVLGRPASQPSIDKVVQLADGAPVPTQLSANAVLVWRGQPAGGITHALEEVKRLTLSSTCRMVFLVDKDAPQFSLSAPLFAEQLRLGQQVNVLQHGTWGCWRALPQPSSSPALAITSISGVKIDALGLNPRNGRTAGEKEARWGHLDYVGRLGSGERVMGVARVTSDRRRPRADPLLRWQVPEAWTDKEAATVPYAYAAMYHALHVLVGIKAGESILIHEGASAMGQAAIRLAVQRRCAPIFVTVASEAERSMIRRHFPEVEERHVLSCANASFEWRIMLVTRTLGVDVVLNALPGEQLRASLRCVAKYGRVLHYGRQDMLERQKFGMYLFNKSACMYGESGARLFIARSADREAVLRGVQEGLASGAVRPIIGARTLSTVEAEDVACWIAKGSDSSKWVMEVTKNKAQAPVENGHAKSYIVMGGGQHEWLQVAGWLSLQGARHVRVLPAPTPGKLDSALVRHRQRELQERYGTTLHVEEARAWDDATTKKVMQATAATGPIDAVVVLTSDATASSGVSALLERSLSAHPGAALVVLTEQPQAAGALSALCEARRQAGLRAACLVAPLSAAAAHLTDLLSGADARPAVAMLPSLISTGRTSTGFEPCLHRPVPASLEALAALGRRLGALPPSGVRLRELRRAAHSRESFPLFVLPPLGALDTAGEAALLQLSLRVVPPIVCVQHRPAADLRPLAAAIAKELTTALPTGPFNLMGLNLSNALAVEVTRLLEAQGHNPVVFLVDGDMMHVKQWAEAQTDLKLLRTAAGEDRDALALLDAASDGDSWASLAPRLAGRVRPEAERVRVQDTLEAVRTGVRGVASHQPSLARLERARLVVIRTSAEVAMSIGTKDLNMQKQLVMPPAEVQLGLSSAWLATSLNENNAWSKLAHREKVHKMVLGELSTPLKFA